MIFYGYKSLINRAINSMNFHDNSSLIIFTFILFFLHFPVILIPLYLNTFMPCNPRPCVGGSVIEHFLTYMGNESSSSGRCTRSPSIPRHTVLARLPWLNLMSRCSWSHGRWATNATPKNLLYASSDAGRNIKDMKFNILYSMSITITLITTARPYKTHKPCLKWLSGYLFLTKP